MLPSEMTFGGPGVLFILQQKKTASHSLVKQFFATLLYRDIIYTFIMTGRIIGFLFVLLYKYFETSSLTLDLICVHSTIPFSRQLSSAFRDISFTSSIISSDSRTYTKPLETMSGPETMVCSVVSTEATTTIKPSCERCLRSRKTYCLRRL